MGLQYGSPKSLLDHFKVNNEICFIFDNLANYILVIILIRITIAIPITISACVLIIKITITKIKRKISELLMEHLKINKKYSEELTIKLERKILLKNDFMNNDYKNMIKGLIKLIKNNKTTIASVNDLINNDYTYMGILFN